MRKIIFLLLSLVDFTVSQRCSDQIYTESEGEIVSHEGYGDGNYDNNLECNFTILTGPQGEQVRRFLHFIILYFKMKFR